jgi:hypothetical protein
MLCVQLSDTDNRKVTSWSEIAGAIRRRFLRKQGRARCDFPNVSGAQCERSASHWQASIHDRALTDVLIAQALDFDELSQELALQSVQYRVGDALLMQKSQ